MPKETPGGVQHDPALEMKVLKGHADIKTWLNSEQTMHLKWQGDAFLEAAHNDVSLQIYLNTLCQQLHPTP